VRFIVLTGCRPEEACSLRWDHVDLERRVCDLALEHKTGSRTGRARLIGIPLALTPDLHAAHARAGRHPEYVFTHRRGKGSVAKGDSDRRAGVPWEPKALGYWFRRHRAEAVAAGVPVDPRRTLYDYRRTFAAHAYAAGLTAEQAAWALGNSARMVDEVYASLAAEEVRDLADRVRGENDDAPGR
jgi:integrase